VSYSPIKLLIIDDDPIFRLGFCTIVDGEKDFEILAQANSLRKAREEITRAMPDLAVLELSLSGSLEFKDEYANLPMLLLGAKSQTQQLLAAKMAGFEGYCPKGTVKSELVAAMRQVALGQTYWQFSPPQTKPGLRSLRQSGIGQIEASLVQVKKKLTNKQLSGLDKLFWRGRQRELLAARWLVKQLLPANEIIFMEKPEKGKQEEIQLLVPASSLSSSWEQLDPREPLARSLKNIRLGLVNHSGIALEMDILQPVKKRELLYLLVNLVGDSLAELRYLQVPPEQLEERIPVILNNLWQNGTIQFLSKNSFSLGNEENQRNIGNTENNLPTIEIILQDAPIVNQAILAKIPLVLELFAYLLFDRPLIIENVSYDSKTPEALARATLLMDNLLINLANGVMQVILNHFGEVEEIKYNLFHQNFRSSRAIARFRNHVSWRYGQDTYYEEPKAIFESKYRLFRLDEHKITTTFLYAPRKEELAKLTGIPWAVTIALETRDALSPRMKSVIAFVGGGLVYFLTQVIGKGLGLIARGIIQAIGSSLQDKK